MLVTLPFSQLLFIALRFSRAGLWLRTYCARHEGPLVGFLVRGHLCGYRYRPRDDRVLSKQFSGITHKSTTYSPSKFMLAPETARDLAIAAENKDCIPIFAFHSFLGNRGFRLFAGNLSHLESRRHNVYDFVLRGTFGTWPTLDISALGVAMHTRKPAVSRGGQCLSRGFHDRISKERWLPRGYGPEGRTEHAGRAQVDLGERAQDLAPPQRCRLASRVWKKRLVRRGLWRSRRVPRLLLSNYLI